MISLSPEWKGFPNLPVYNPIGRDGWPQENGWTIERKPGVGVLGRFSDGSTAITENRYGKDTAIYFAANPFIPECLLGDRWDLVFREFQFRMGARTDGSVWRSKFPAP